MPLMTMEKYGEVNRKLTQQVEELKNEKMSLLREIGQLDSRTHRWLVKTMKEKDTDLRTTQELLRKETETRAQLETENNLLRNSHSRMRELYEASTMKPTEEVRTMPQTVEPNPPIMERITEKKETITEKFVSQQPLQSSATPLKTPSDLVLCPKTTDMVSIDDACKKCLEYVTCPQYGEYFMLKRAIRNDSVNS